MQKRFIRKKGSTIQKQIFLRFTLIVCSQVFLIWAVGMLLINVQLNREQNKDFITLQNRITSQYNETIQGCLNFVLMMRDSGYIDNISDNHNSYNYSKIKQFMSSGIAANSFIDGAFLYLKDQDVVIPTFGLITNKSSFLEQFIKFEKKNSFDLSKKLDNTVYNKILLDKLTYGLAFRDSLLFLGKVTEYNSSQNIVVGLIINHDTIMDRVDLSLFNNIECTLFDKDTAISFIKHDSNYTNSNGIFKLKALQSNVDLLYGLSYVIKCNDSALNEKALIIQTGMLSALLITLLITFIWVYLSSKDTVKPLDRLKELLTNSEDGDQKYLKDINWLENEIREIVQKEHEAVDALQKVSPNLQLYYINKLLDGNLENQETLRLGLKISDIIFPYKKFACIIVESAYLKTSDQFDIKSLQCENSVIYGSFTKQEGIGLLKIILNFDKESIQTLLLTKLEASLLNITSQFVICIGNTKINMQDIHKSFKEALFALEHKKINKDNEIISYDNIKTESSKPYTLSKPQEELFKNHLQQKNYIEAKHIANQIITQNIDRGIDTLQIIKNLYNHLMNDLCFSIEDIDVKTICNSQYISHFNSLQDIDDHLVKVFKLLSDKYPSTSSGDDKIKEKIILYINKHFTDSNLCLSIVADHLNIHKVYLSKYFNQSIGCSFVEYVNKKRINHSIELMKNNSYTISQISQLSGFNSDVTYRREFKKYIGMTPNEYREHRIPNKE